MTEMDEITEIQIMMTAALVLYGLGIFLGLKQRKWKLPRFVHFSCGFSGFFLDMWATWKMEELRHAGWEAYGSDLLLLGHTVISTLAILFFLSIAFFGMRRRIRYHRIVIFYYFVPAWLLSYTSGIALVILSPD